MEITNDGIEFTSEDAQLLRAFLKTQAGSRMIPKMLEATPPLLDGGGANEILIRSGMVKGFQMAAQQLLSMAYPPPNVKPPTSEYPALTDDEAWADGQKIEIPKP